MEDILKKDRMSIIIVEDESVVALSLKRCLEGVGYVVPAVALYGEVALQKVEEFRPDLVLMDIKLKGAMDGVETAEQIIKQYNIPVIYLTANIDKKTFERAEASMKYGYLSKPIDENILEETISKAIEVHRRSSSNFSSAT